MQSFRAVWWRRLDEGFFTVLFALLLVLTVVAVVQSHRWIMILFCFLWLVMLGGCFFVVLTSICEIRIEGNHLWLRSFLTSITLQGSEIESIQGTVASKSSTIEIVDRQRKRKIIYLKSYDNPSSLMSALDVWWSTVRIQNPVAHSTKPRRFRAKGFSILFGVLVGFLSIFFIGAPLTDPKVMPMLWLTVPLMVLLLAILALSIRSFVSIEEEGMIVQRYLSPRRIPWEAVKRVRLSTVSVKGSQQETLTIEWGDRKEIINGLFDDFPLIRDTILTHIPASIVVDDRRRI